MLYPRLLIIDGWGLYCIKPQIDYSGNKQILKGAEVFMFPSLGQVTADSNQKNEFEDIYIYSVSSGFSLSGHSPLFLWLTL